MNKWLARLCMAMVTCEVVLAVISWLYAALSPSSGIHSLLTSEGVRWLFGGYVSRMLSHDMLIWLIYAGMSYGILSGCGVLSYNSVSYRSRVALRFAACVLIAYFCVMSLLAFVPHAILLSATGHLIPSPFSQSLIVLLSIGVIIFSLVYGVMSGRYPDVLSVFESLVNGVRLTSPWLIVYLLAAHLYDVVMYIIP